MWTPYNLLFFSQMYLSTSPPFYCSCSFFMFIDVKYSNIWLCHSSFSSSTVSGYLGCCYLFAIMNSIAKSISVHTDSATLQREDFCLNQVFFSFKSSTLDLLFIFCYIISLPPFVLSSFYFDFRKAVRNGQLIPICPSSVFFRCYMLPYLLYIYPFLPSSSFSCFFLPLVLLTICLAFILFFTLRTYSQNTMSQTKLD